MLCIEAFQTERKTTIAGVAPAKGPPNSIKIAALRLKRLRTQQPYACHFPDIEITSLVPRGAHSSKARRCAYCALGALFLAAT